jgi:hypothetical protein
VSGSYRAALREGSAFFAREGRVWETLRRICRAFEQERIPYAISGGMATVLHGCNRYTDTIEVLTSANARDQARQVAGDPQAGVNLKFITGAEPRDASVEIDGYDVIALPKLIELKLASGLTAEHRRHRDLGDVERLIATLKLPRELGDQLDASVRDEYFRMWNAAQTPDPHEQGS